MKLFRNFENGSGVNGDEPFSWNISVRIRTGTAASAPATYTIWYGTSPGYSIKVDMIIPPASGAIVRLTSVAEEYCPSIAPLFSGNRSAITAEMTGPRIAVAVP